MTGRRWIALLSAASALGLVVALGGSGPRHHGAAGGAATSATLASAALKPASAPKRSSPCPDTPFTATAQRPGSETGVAAGFAVLRRAGTAADRAANDPVLGAQLEGQLASYDPQLTRQVPAPPPRPLSGFGSYSVANFLLVGDGAADQVAVSAACLRTLPRARQAAYRRAIALARSATPSGPAFCFVGQPTFNGTVAKHPYAESLCDTVAHAQQGYGLAIIDFGRQGPAVAGPVPDGVASVALHYRGHPVVHAAVHDNVYFARVPALPPLDDDADRNASYRVLRRKVLRGIATEIQWLGAGGQVTRSFRPPAGEVSFLTDRYEECLRTDCGA